MQENLLCFGDNANFLRDCDLFPDESVDLIYLDPPFNSQRPYNVLFKEVNGTPAEAQIKAFDDTWRWDEAAARQLDYMLTQPDAAPQPLVALLKTFDEFLGHNEMFAYLVNMAARLAMLHRVLKKTGSLYLHCDPTASHYLKLVLDAIFGPKNSRRELIWKRSAQHGGASCYNSVHDTILYFGKSRSVVWNPQHTPYSPEYLEKFFRHEDEHGRYQLISLTGAGEGPPRRLGDRQMAPPPGRHWAYAQEKLDELYSKGRIVFSSGGVPRLKWYAHERPGVPLTDIWTDLPFVSSHSRERLGFPTQKPLALLRRIVSASSNPGDVILDPFCGCGTTVEAVELLNRDQANQPARRWIGIDITYLSINLIKHRLSRLDPPPEHRVLGEPADTASAAELARMDRFQFQYWALGLIGARPWGGPRKKGKDAGIDGVLYFKDDARGTIKSAMVQVKSGQVRPADVRDLRGVIERENAAMAVFITLQPPTADMTKEAVNAGLYHSDGWNKDYPRLQILTIEELLADPSRPHPACLRMPPRELADTFRMPRKRKRNPNSKDIWK